MSGHRQSFAHDTGKDDPNQILIFCTEEDFDFMVKQPHWFADCTFKCSPEIYYHVFSLHVYVSGTVVRVLHVLLPYKPGDTYIRLLTKIAQFRNFRYVFDIPKVRYSDGSIFRKFDIPKVRYSEGSIFRRFDIPKIPTLDNRANCHYIYNC
jgi:hypothetical protein